MQEEKGTGCCFLRLCTFYYLSAKIPFLKEMAMIVYGRIFIMSLLGKIKNGQCHFHPPPKKKNYGSMSSHNLGNSDPCEVMSPEHRVLSKFGYLPLAPCRGYPDGPKILES